MSKFSLLISLFAVLTTCTHSEEPVAENASPISFLLQKPEQIHLAYSGKDSNSLKKPTFIQFLNL